MISHKIYFTNITCVWFKYTTRFLHKSVSQGLIKLLLPKKVIFSYFINQIKLTKLKHLNCLYYFYDNIFVTVIFFPSQFNILEN